MPKLNKIGYSLKDVAIIPSVVSDIRHRSDVDPFVEICGRKSFPIFVSPMASVTDEQNYKVWIDNKITPVVPRSVMGRMSFEERLNLAEETFVAISLSEAEEFADYEIPSNFNKKYICIDMANGHMKSLLDVCKRIKDAYGDNVELMTGNIANPQIYPLLCESKIDWIRCFVGTGSRCVTSNTTSVHYPPATFLDEVNEIRKAYLFGSEDKFSTKIIADGGISWYDDINKSLALGADAVMMGKMFAECEEACGPILYSRNENEFTLGYGFEPKDFNKECVLKSECYRPYRNYAGMSHRSMQKITGGDGSKVSEGIVKPVEVKYPVSHFLGNVEAYLRSSMSYANAHTIEEFRNNTQLIILGGMGRSTYEK